MKLLYLNNELAVADGCNAHALGMLSALEKIIGKENIFTYPKPKDCSAVQYVNVASQIKERFAPLLQIVRYYRKTLMSYKIADVLLKEMQEKGFSPTHILVRSSVFETAAVKIAEKTGAKLICEMNTPFYYEWCVTRKLPLKNKVERWESRLLNKADYIYVVSEELKCMYMKHYNIAQSKFVVVPNGYNTDLYQNYKSDYLNIRNNVRRAEKIESKFVVTFVGSLKIWHGIDMFCKTAEFLQNDKNIVFMVLGDGEQRGLITDYISKHSNMIFKGKLSYEDMRNYLYASDLGIMPYKVTDNFYFSPLKMYDMIGAKLPFVGTDIGQIGEMCRCGLNTDFLIESPEAVSLADKLRKLSDKPKTYHEMKNLLQDNSTNFTWDSRAKILLDGIEANEIL